MQKAKKGEFALHEDLKTDEDWQEIQEKKVGLRGHRVLANPCFEIERYVYRYLHICVQRRWRERELERQKTDKQTETEAETETEIE